MKYIKSIFIRGIIGIPIGVFISFTFIIIFNFLISSPSTISSKYLVTQYFLGSCIGFLYSSLSVVFEIKNWSFTKQTFIHCSVTTIILLTCLLLSNIISITLISITLYIIIILTIYFIIWICFKIFFSNGTK